MAEAERAGGGGVEEEEEELVEGVKETVVVECDDAVDEAVCKGGEERAEDAELSGVSGRPTTRTELMRKRREEAVREHSTVFPTHVELWEQEVKARADAVAAALAVGSGEEKSFYSLCSGKSDSASRVERPTRRKQVVAPADRAAGGWLVEIRRKRRRTPPLKPLNIRQTLPDNVPALLCNHARPSILTHAQVSTRAPLWKILGRGGNRSGLDYMDEPIYTSFTLGRGGNVEIRSGRGRMSLHLMNHLRASSIASGALRNEAVEEEIEWRPLEVPPEPPRFPPVRQPVIPLSPDGPEESRELS